MDDCGMRTNKLLAVPTARVARMLAPLAFSTGHQLVRTNEHFRLFGMAEADRGPTDGDRRNRESGDDM